MIVMAAILISKMAAIKIQLILLLRILQFQGPINVAIPTYLGS